MYLFTQGWGEWGRVEPERMFEGQQFTRLRSSTAGQMPDTFVETQLENNRLKPQESKKYL
jgi:hypothetical protein